MPCFVQLKSANSFATSADAMKFNGPAPEIINGYSMPQLHAHCVALLDIIIFILNTRSSVIRAQTFGLVDAGALL